MSLWRRLLDYLRVEPEKPEPAAKTEPARPTPAIPPAAKTTPTPVAPKPKPVAPPAPKTAATPTPKSPVPTKPRTPQASPAPAPQTPDPVLVKHGVRYLYHMTHKDNLPNILRQGLLSHNAAHGGGHNARNIADPNVTGIRARKVEPIHGRLINDYVPLYFNPKNAMLYVRKHIQGDIVILGIDPNVILEPQSIFTDGNAASGGTSFFNDVQHLARLSWECIRGPSWNAFPDGRRIRCAEVLVYPAISVSRVRAVFCNSPTTLATVKPLLAAQPHIVSSVDRSFYF